jgi:group II intron reverse transcriptase/maturase
MLDHLISRKTLRQAFERVRDNSGCPGADGMSVHDFAADLETELGRMEDRLLRRRYRPFPLLRFAVSKRGGGVRYLCVPTVRDRVVQTAVHLVTVDLFEAEFEECSHAYRRGRSVRTAIHRVRELRDQGYRFLVDADVDGFFDNLPHEPLFAKLRRLKLDPYVVQLFEDWVRAEAYDGERVFPLTRGVPQGSVVSPMLANLFLDELDENLAELGQAAVRYADDILVLAKSPEAAAEALELTDLLVAELGLRLNREKTVTTSFEQGFQFLGAIFLKDSIFLPFERAKVQAVPPILPPPLDLWSYLELRGLEPPCPTST